MFKVNEQLKNEIIQVLSLYKEGEVYTYLPENKQRLLDSVNPYFHENKKMHIKTNEGELRRLKFNICSENRWNYIRLNEEQINNIINKCKQILDKYGIKYDQIDLTYYYPKMESTFYYSDWNRCLEIYYYA